MAAPSIKAAAKTAVSEAVEAARIAAPSIITQLDAGSLKLKNASRSKGNWTAQAKTEVGIYSKSFRTADEAACAADLSRLALHSSVVTSQQLNFPPEVYQQQHVAAWAALMQQKQPGLRLPAWDAATAAELAARAAAERAAVRAAADAAASVRLAAPAAAQQLEAILAGGNFVEQQAANGSVLWRWKLVHAGKTLSWLFSSRLEACCAADLARLALYGALVGSLNLPAATYTQQQLAVWQT